MKFTQLDVSGFGVWSSLELQSLSPQLTVIYGPNEAGKTTILECLRGVLYGFSPMRRDRYLPPVHGGEGGGSVGLCIDRQSHTIARLDDGSRLAGGVTVTGPDGSTQGESQLRELLRGIDETAFTNIFSVGLRELQELATLNDSEVASWLYDLSTGLEGVSISDTLRELRASRARLVSPAGEKSQVIDLLSQRDALRAEIEELSTLHDRYWRLSIEQAAAGEAIRAAETSLATRDAEVQKLDAALAIRGPWGERALLDEKLAAYGGLGDFPADALRRLEAVLAGLRKARRRRARVKRRWQAARAQRRRIKVNERLWRQAARIAALAEHEHWIATLDEQLRAAEQNVAEHERELAAARANCGLPEDTTAKSEALSATAAAGLRGPAKQLRAARKRLKEARGACESLRETRKARRDEVAAALTSRGEANLAAALVKQGQLVAQYRRRLQLDDRLDQMAMHREELEEKHRKLLDRQVLPLWLLIAIAVVFVLGGGLVLAGLIIPWGTGTAVLGGLIATGAAAGKFGWQRSAANRLEATEKQLKMLKRQLEQAKAERSELDELLPAGGGALASRLQSAEGELASLEELLSVDARRQAADDEAVAVKSRLKAAGQEWSRARREWQEGLGEAGLPAELSPAQVKQMFAHAGSLQPLERRLQQAREERDRWRREQAAVAARIEQLGAEAGWEKPDHGTPAAPLVEQLRRLRREVATEEELVERRRELDERLERLRRLGLKYGRLARWLARRRRELYRTAGALDENDFRRRAEQRAELDELLRRRGALGQQIQAALQGVSSEQEVAVLLGLPSGQLERQREELVARRQAAAADIKRLSEERGAMAHEQALLADDRRLAHQQVELDVVEERLAEAAARWRTLALTEYLIETVKEDYERNRQPEVLQEASRYLERMTEGRYRRVWTPLGEQTLRVDDDENRPLAIELLSTGAREQLFLNLRLALVRRFAGQGKAMPLVLDDVLVNFDKQRAAAAATVFAEFAAAGHQLLVFTCHEHIADLFRGLRCDVRSLPANVDGSRKIVGPQIDEHAGAVEPPRRRREKRAKEQPQSEPLASLVDSQAAASSGDNGELGEESSGHAPEPIALAAAPSETMPAPKSARRHRADPPHETAPVKATRRSRWSAEEFDGELQDQVNAAFANDQ
ncbi:MAG: AAA family ATPase [Pirellulales bacterium]